MSCRRFNVARAGLPDLILIRYAGSDAAGPAVSYIVCINGRVPENYAFQEVRRSALCDLARTFV